MSLEYGIRLGISIALFMLPTAGCGSGGEDFRMLVSPLNGETVFWASKVTYEIRRDSLGSVEQGDFTLLHWDIGPADQRWEHVTVLPAGDDYHVDVSASGDTSRCTGSGTFTVPPDQLTIFLICGEPPSLPADFETPEDVVFMVGTVVEKEATR